MPGRIYNGGNYRYGFNGKENDNEVKGNGNSLDFGARMYDPRLGRWLSVDPKFIKYPDWSPYKANKDNPIIYNDPDGKDEFLTIILLNMQTGRKESMVIKMSNEVFTDNVTHRIDAGGEDWYNEKRWYDKSTTLIIIKDKNGNVTRKSETKLLKDKVKSTTSGPLINSSTYAMIKSELYETDNALDERMKQIADEIKTEYGASSNKVKDPVTESGSDELNTWLFMLKGEVGDPTVNDGYYGNGKGKSTQDQIRAAKHGDTLIGEYGDGEGNSWLQPQVKDTTSPSGARSVSGEASDTQVKKYGGPK